MTLATRIRRINENESGANPPAAHRWPGKIWSMPQFRTPSRSVESGSILLMFMAARFLGSVGIPRRSFWKRMRCDNRDPVAGLFATFMTSSLPGDCLSWIEGCPEGGPHRAARYR